MKYAKPKRYAYQKPREGSKSVKILISILVVFMAVCAGGMYISTLSSNLDPNAVKGTLGTTGSDALNAQTAAHAIPMIINAKPAFDDGLSEGSIFFENIEGSGKWLRLEYYRDDTGELIYKSGYLEPGTYIAYAALDVDLDEGEYPCTAYIYGYDADTQEYIGKVAAGVTVYVLG